MCCFYTIMQDKGKITNDILPFPAKVVLIIVQKDNYIFFSYSIKYPDRNIYMR